MKVYRGFEDINFDADTALTIGTFDGVHKGHRSLLLDLLRISDEENLRNLVITFDPHPQIVLNKKPEPVKLLTSIQERLDLFDKIGIANVLIIPFNKDFAAIAPEEFIVDYLVKKTGLSRILVGHDHLFGRNREGNEQLLKKLGSKYNFSVSALSAFEDDSIVVSSSKIRQLITDYKLETANSFLGYRYFVSGKVVLGDRRGNTIGYPTANIQSDDSNKLLPANGVYLVKAVIDSKTEYGMANIGLRPTFTNNTEPTLEVFFFNFDKDIYDKEIRVQFLKFVRAEKKFASLEEFLKQLKSDEIFCRKNIPDFYI